MVYIKEDIHIRTFRGVFKGGGAKGALVQSLDYEGQLPPKNFNRVEEKREGKKGGKEKEIKEKGEKGGKAKLFKALPY